MITYTGQIFNVTSRDDAGDMIMADENTILVSY